MDKDTALLLLDDAVASMAFEDMEPPNETKEKMLRIIMGDLSVADAIAAAVDRYKV